MARNGLKTVRDNRAALARALRALGQSDVLVGVPGDDVQKGGTGQGADARRAERPGEAAPTINNATLAYIQNNGSAAANIPARPFMEPGLADAGPEMAEAAASGAAQAAEGGVGAVDQALTAIGRAAQDKIRRRIAAGVPPPLKPATLAEHGRDGAAPLDARGQLLNAINFVVRKRSQ